MGHHHEEKRIQDPALGDLYRQLDRRNFLNRTAMGMGAVALQQLL